MRRRRRSIPSSGENVRCSYKSSHAASRQKVEKVFEEFHLSPFAMAAAKKWVKLMADPSKTNLTRIRDWLLLRINNKHRAPPASRWQKGCPDLVPGLRALPFWDRGMPEMGWVREIEDHFEDVKEVCPDLCSPALVLSCSRALLLSCSSSSALLSLPRLVLVSDLERQRSC